MSWLPIAADSPFSIANIPFGIISTESDKTHRPAIAIGDHALDLKAFAARGGFKPSKTITESEDVFSQTTLNSFAHLGQSFHREVREYLQSIFRDDTPHPQVLKDNESLRESALLPLSGVTNHMPMAIGDYTDFYASTNHAYNVGVLFRGPENALQPNYKHLPVAYHGRASSVVVSGTPIRRPWGQILRDPKAEPKVPALAPCERLDLELEMGMFVCRPNDLGKPVPVDEAEQHIFGYVLMNDWSARDIQAWEYVPLGPFTSKNLGTSISPWVVLADAAIPKTTGLPNENELLPYLKEKKTANFLDIHLEVDLITASGNKKTITKTNSKNLLWSWPQMIAHHTITGCNLQPGDLFGSGTISGSEPGTEGCLLEQTKGGKATVTVADGEERKFLKDGDSIVIRGWAGEDGARIGFGEVSGMIEAALPLF
ncbi:Fumarylacetoacetase-like protein [Hapsidospora chrysogenum ATCC 11550]|uniref:Fumarylacetoacetase n=1 Tax=Hapsidospora chrysogenum (strain ATCC 11550 / CBS 779.69 / DSM 880 / IAM 14645 / JCM 23072 / IMI 49137) TaxID=857340 RepID=A0A086SVA3_HAPC1|nr:Fumarylacetoacetase-like protein [Hapsidospora chrysogenum ATCC 11550]